MCCEGLCFFNILWICHGTPSLTFYFQLFSHIFSFNRPNIAPIDMCWFWIIQVRSNQSQWQLQPHQLHHVIGLHQGNCFILVTAPFVDVCNQSTNPSPFLQTSHLETFFSIIQHWLHCCFTICFCLAKKKKKKQ